ncbi:preprotein translocase subunit SecE [Porticoccaceae bacterium LTM1]|nr:preprotein translocase subunit SecE [Porticoccaceae bacterium LTM1]
MSAVTEESRYRLDGLKWLLVALLVAGAVYGNHHFGAEPFLYRLLGVLAAIGVALVIALRTAKGADFWALVKGAQVEARKVVWPTRQERNQITLMVVVVVIVMALILWGLDALFGWIAALIIG